jgi:Calcineurin-like phosphoesterase
MEIKTIVHETRSAYSILTDLLASYTPKPASWRATVLSDLIPWCQIIAEGQTATAVLVTRRVAVVTDTQGDFDTLLEWLQECPELAVYLREEEIDPSHDAPDLVFLGNVVGRSPRSLDTLILVMCIYVMHPDRVSLLQGRHEDFQTGRLYGFMDLCKKILPCPLDYYREIFKFFSFLPIIAIFGRVCLTHAGIDPIGVPKLDQREEIDNMFSGSLDSEFEYWNDNHCGVNYDFGIKALGQWLQKLDCVGFINTGGDLGDGFCTNLDFDSSDMMAPKPFFISLRSSTKHFNQVDSRCAMLILDSIDSSKKINVQILIKDQGTLSIIERKNKVIVLE